MLIHSHSLSIPLDSVLVYPLKKKNNLWVIVRVAVSQLEVIERMAKQEVAVLVKEPSITKMITLQLIDAINNNFVNHYSFKNVTCNRHPYGQTISRKFWVVILIVTMTAYALMYKFNTPQTLLQPTYWFATYEFSQKVPTQ